MLTHPSGFGKSSSVPRESSLKNGKSEIEVLMSKPVYVYRLTNENKKEIYFGVSKDPAERFKQHCVGTTIELSNWNCDRHDIKSYRHGSWSFQSQSAASTKAHALEDSYSKSGYKVFNTRGI